MRSYVCSCTRWSSSGIGCHRQQTPLTNQRCNASNVAFFFSCRHSPRARKDSSRGLQQLGITDATATAARTGGGSPWRPGASRVVGGPRGGSARVLRGAGTAVTSNNQVQASLGHLEVGAGPAWSGAGTAGTSNSKVQAPPVQRAVGAGTAGIGFRRRRHRAWRGAGTAGTSNNRVQASPVHLQDGAGTASSVF